jgi:hypothetical protein
MGRRKEPVGPYSDVYGWAKTCCYALFGTTQPLLKHWKSVPEPLAELLEKCLEEDPRRRPAGFAEVLRGLGMREGPAAPASPAPVGREQEFDLEGHAGEAVAARMATTTRRNSEKSQVPWVLPVGREDEVVEASIVPSKSPGVAAVLEVVGGALCGTFGVGHVYAGRVGLGLLIMFGCWFVFFINILLCEAVIGFLTLPLSWLAAMIVCPISAAHSARSG